jgi:putative peptide zinc metalloprotease protein
MSRLRRAIVSFGLSAGLLLSPAPSVLAQDPSNPSPTPGPEGPGGAGGDTTAIALNTKDGKDIFRIAFAIKRAMGDVVDNTNAAVAFASCTDCQTVAVSIQVVLMMNEPSIVTPTNLAIAINQECTLCETLASAYQVILTTDGPVKFTPEGRREIAAISRELRAMRHAGLTIAEILAHLDELTDRFFRVLMEEIVEVGPSESGSETAAPSTGDGSSPSDATSPSASPTPSTPSPTPSSSPTPSPSVSP